MSLMKKGRVMKRTLDDGKIDWSVYFNEDENSATMSIDAYVELVRNGKLLQALYDEGLEDFQGYKKAMQWVQNDI